MFGTPSVSCIRQVVQRVSLLASSDTKEQEKQLSVIRPRPKQLQWPIIKNAKNKTNPSMRTRDRGQVRENACDQVAIGYASDWLSRWREFFLPITECSKAKPKQLQKTSFGQLRRFLHGLEMSIAGYMIWLTSLSDFTLFLSISRSLLVSSMARRSFSFICNTKRYTAQRCV